MPEEEEKEGGREERQLKPPRASRELRTASHENLDALIGNVMKKDEKKGHMKKASKDSRAASVDTIDAFVENNMKKEEKKY